MFEVVGGWTFVMINVVLDSSSKVFDRLANGKYSTDTLTCYILILMWVKWNAC